ncbi:MAG: sulfite exporter TauE/SafE family protein [Leptospiraceae bacterium]|nr:sulfite exporter TauE/SafE family protein [Leptospiraceae bacterium]MDW8307245.1 sulfite exporter TauE/SafE family protein [Leptospiraceae bacterium]
MWQDVSPLYRLAESIEVGSLILVFLGFLVGAISALLGVGGGFFFTPFFNTILGLPAGYAVATSMAQIPFQAASAVFLYARKKVILYKEALLILVFSFISSQLTALGVSAAQRSFLAEQQIYKKVSYLDFGLVVIYSSFIGGLGSYSIYQGLKRAKPIIKPSEGERPFLRAALLGLLYGALSSLLGIGGGFLTVPYFLYVRRTTPVEAVATSLFMLFVTTSLAFLNYLWNDQVYLSLALLVALGGVFGGQIGARLSFRVKPNHIKLALGSLQLLVMASYIYLKLLR